MLFSQVNLRITLSRPFHLLSLRRDENWTIVLLCSKSVNLIGGNWHITISGNLHWKYFFTSIFHRKCIFLICLLSWILVKYFICSPSKSYFWCFMFFFQGIFWGRFFYPNHIYQLVLLSLYRSPWFCLFILYLSISLMLTIFFPLGEVVFLLENLDFFQAISFM